MGAMALNGCSFAVEVAWLVPTATQAQLVTQSTPVNDVSTAPVAFGEAAALQLWPFHVKASVTWVEPPESVHTPPTAVHDVALKQLTPMRNWPKAGGVLGTGGSSAQVDPFQFRIAFSYVGGPVISVYPTAVQKPAIPTQDTEVIVVVVVVEGIASVVQLVPFHNALHAPSVEPLPTLPTAMQYAGVVHDTAPTDRPSSPEGVGAVVGAQVEPFHSSA